MRILRAPAVCLFLGLSIFAADGTIAAPSDDNAGPANPIFDTAMSRGDVLLAGGDNAGAEKQYRAALQQAPTGEARADVLHKLGIALAHQGRFSEAEPLVSEAEDLARARPGGVLLADVLRAKTVILYRTGRIEAARAAFREAKRILEANANAWQTGPDGTTWHHTPSNWRFTNVNGPFKRIRRTMLDETGHNIVVHYRIGEKGWGASLVSVYLSVDRDVPLAGEFEATRNEIIRQFPNAKTLRTGSKEISGDDGFETVIDLPPSKNGKTRRTSLTAFARGNALLRFRASYPAAEAAIRADQVQTLIRAIMKQ
jgi:tetratricopeptide (TPR) repeat protein